jgi:hypothetical protein
MDDRLSEVLIVVIGFILCLLLLSSCLTFNRGEITSPNRYETMKDYKHE